MIWNLKVLFFHQANETKHFQQITSKRKVKIILISVI